ncbi:Nuclear transport factor 2 (NTF2) family protein, partial [Thalictrum thalictroides]
MDPIREATAKEAHDTKNVFKRLSDDIIPHILKLYGSSATAQDFEIYAPNATFEDPLMRAHG